MKFDWLIIFHSFHRAIFHSVLKTTVFAQNDNDNYQMWAVEQLFLEYKHIICFLVDGSKGTQQKHVWVAKCWSIAVFEKNRARERCIKDLDPSSQHSSLSQDTKREIQTLWSTILKYVWMNLLTIFLSFWLKCSSFLFSSFVCQRSVCVKKKKI